MNEQKKVWIADLKYGKPELTAITVLKETEKTYTKDGREKQLLGSLYLPKRINKTDYHCFDTPVDALEWLYQQAVDYVERCRTAVATAEKRVAELDELMAAGVKQ